MVKLLKEYIDYFSWDYDELLGLERSIVEHKLPIKPGYKPVKQQPRRMTLEATIKVKEEIKRLLKVGFIRIARYVEWLSNIVPIIKKNGKLRVCIDYRNLNSATPKDECHIPVVDLLVDRSAGHSIMSMMDGHSGYNHICISKEDIHKITFRCQGEYWNLGMGSNAFWIEKYRCYLSKNYKYYFSRYDWNFFGLYI